MPGKHFTDPEAGVRWGRRLARDLELGGRLEGDPEAVGVSVALIGDSPFPRSLV